MMDNSLLILLLSIIVIMMSFYVYETERKLLHMEEKLLKQVSISDTVERKLLQMKENISKREVKSDTAGIVAFAASIHATYHVDQGQILKFKTVWVNIGNGYDPESGVFTATKSGLNLVSYTINAALYERIRCNLWKNDIQSVGSSGAWHAAGTWNILMIIQKGDRLFIRCSNHGKLLNDTSTFSAVEIKD